MNFKTLDIKFSYETGEDDLVNDFYIPVLLKAKQYDRIAGFFSSSSLAVAARGISGLISNGGTMRIVACPRMSAEDIEMIEKAVMKPEEVICRRILIELEHIEKEFEKDHISALGWLLAKGFLQIKIALVSSKNKLCEYNEIDERAIFHQKVGILYDLEGNSISFSGSINETASGWLENIEEFKVFKSWEDGQKDYLHNDIAKFDDFWNDSRNNVKIFDLPSAIKQKMLEYGQNFSNEAFVLGEHKAKYTVKKPTVEEKLSLFFYQKNAVNEWRNNNYNLLFEMATGTGKTRTAIACINEIMKIEEKLITIISCPQGTLSKQWKYEIETIGLTADESIIVDGTNKKWRKELEKSIKQVSVGYNDKLIIYTTHATGSCKDFIDIILLYGRYIPICFVGDEAHGLGANIAKKGLLDIYKYRIGLSATPKRWFDDVGSAILTEYFGNKSFEFTIGDALSTINPITNKPFLVNYYYHPFFVELTDDEFEEYHKLSTRIKKMSVFSKNSDDYHKKFESLLFARANIEKNAVNKYAALEEILTGYKNVKDTIIFTSNEQIDNVLHMLSSRSIIAHRFTQAEGTSSEVKYYGKSERQYLIHKFKDGTYQALVAIKCLDEGIDIPSASTAIIMASSTNPREYIQRIGRVIRQAKGKTRAHIFDFILEPNIDRLKNPAFVEFEKKIFNKEMNRVEDMSMNAINNAEVMLAISERLRRL